MTDDPTGPIGRIYSFAEAAKTLGISRKKLDDLVRVFPLYTPNGNRKLFSEDDIKALWQVRRIGAPQGECGAATPRPMPGQKPRYSDRLARGPRSRWPART
jgi:hypothetical protein